MDCPRPQDRVVVASHDFLRGGLDRRGCGPCRHCDRLRVSAARHCTPVPESKSHTLTPSASRIQAGRRGLHPLGQHAARL